MNNLPTVPYSVKILATDAANETINNLFDQDYEMVGIVQKFDFHDGETYSYFQMRKFFDYRCSYLFVSQEGEILSNDAFSL